MQLPGQATLFCGAILWRYLFCDAIQLLSAYCLRAEQAVGLAMDPLELASLVERMNLIELTDPFFLKRR